jgi:hypothetical protein
MDWTHEVREICSAHDLGPTLAVILEIMWTVFHPIQQLWTEVDVDPDTDERRIVFEVTVDASADEALRCYGEFIRAMIASVPADKREWARLSFHPLRNE